MPVERRHREASLAAHGVLPMHFYAWSEWLDKGGDVFEDPGHTHCMVDENSTAKAIAAAEARGVEAGKKAAIDVLRSHCLFDRKHQAEQQKLADHGDLNARGRAYEHELRADYLQELIDACEDAGGAREPDAGEGSE